MPENFADIVISGAGPNGLVLACELALAGIRPIVLDALPEPSPEPKANGLVGQVARVLDLRGLYDAFSGVAGPPNPVNRYIFGAMPLDLTAVQPNPVNLIMRPQPQMVRLLTDHAVGLGVDLRWGHALTEIDSGDGEVTVSVSGPDENYRLRTRFLVGADGGKSLVRKRIGVDFPGVTATGHVSRVGHVTMPDGYRTGDGGIDIPGVGRFGLGHHRLERGMFVYAEIQPGNPMVGAVEFDGGDAFGDDTPLTIDELRASVERVLGVPLALTAPTGPGPHALRRTVGQNTRVAERYREGNILLLGDAAHVHSAMGGPGLNLGLQDTVNLGWKLAAEIQGWAPPGLLDTYESERHPAAERVVMYSLSQSALIAPGPDVTELRKLFGELLDLPVVAAHIANLLAGSDIRYDTGDSHPLSGYLAPEVSIETADGATRIAELLHEARPVLLVFEATADPTAAATGWTDRVTVVEATAATPPAAALLIRPDGYIAWATDDFTPQSQGSLHTALHRWFGEPALVPTR